MIPLYLISASLFIFSGIFFDLGLLFCCCLQYLLLFDEFHLSIVMTMTLMTNEYFTSNMASDRIITKLLGNSYE